MRVLADARGEGAAGGIEASMSKLHGGSSANLRVTMRAASVGRQCPARAQATRAQAAGGLDMQFPTAQLPAEGSKCRTAQLFDFGFFVSRAL